MAYVQWKRHLPLCYDFFTNHELTVPSPCVRWGHVISTDKETITQRYVIPRLHVSGVVAWETDGIAVSSLYYSERGAVVNNVVIAEASVATEWSSDPDKMVPPLPAPSPLLPARCLRAC